MALDPGPLQVLPHAFETHAEVMQDIAELGFWPTTYVSDRTDEVPLHWHGADVCGYVLEGSSYILDATGARHELVPGTTYHYVGAEAKADAEGWESLGDMGYMDEDGFLYLTDRQTDMILSGGANIYPAEVEGAIEAFPRVRSCAVIGLPHEDLGNAVHAIIDMAGSPVAEQDILDHLAERLVRYKIPRSLEFVDEPLRDDAGKVRRKALREARLG